MTKIISYFKYYLLLLIIYLILYTFKIFNISYTLVMEVLPNSNIFDYKSKFKHVVLTLVGKDIKLFNCNEL